MGKTAKKQAAQCSNHEFAMIPLSNDLYFKQSVTLSFCKAKAQPKSKSTTRKNKAKGAECLCCPVYNRDNNYATSTFILPEEKQNYIENEMRFKLEHQCRIKEYSGEKSQILIPKPKTKQSYCNVCRANYEDYLDHIKSEIHKNYIKRSPFARCIKEMENRYDAINHGRNSQSKNNFNNDTTQNGIQSEQENEMIGMIPNKKLKRDFSFTPAFCYSVTVNPMAIPQLTPFSQIPVIQPMGSIQQITSLPIQYVNSEMGYQMQGAPILTKNDNLPTASMIPQFPYQQMGFNYGINPNMFFSIPMLYCNSFQSFPQLQHQPFVNIPSFHSEIQLTSGNP